MSISEFVNRISFDHQAREAFQQDRANYVRAQSGLTAAERELLIGGTAKEIESYLNGAESNDRSHFHGSHRGQETAMLVIHIPPGESHQDGLAFDMDWQHICQSAQARSHMNAHRMYIY